MTKPQHAEVFSSGRVSKDFHPSKPLTFDPLSLRRSNSTPTVPCKCRLTIRPPTVAQSLTARNLSKLEANNNEDASCWHADQIAYMNRAFNLPLIRKSLRKVKSELKITKEDLARSEKIQAVFNGSARFTLSVIASCNTSHVTLATSRNSLSMRSTPTLVDAVEQSPNESKVDHCPTHNRILRAPTTKAISQLSNTSDRQTHKADHSDNYSTGRKGASESQEPRPSSPYQWHDRLVGVGRRMSSRRNNTRTSSDGRPIRTGSDISVD